MHGLSISCGPRGAELQTTGTVADRVVRSRAKSQHRIRRFAYVPSSAQPAEAATFTVRRQVECARCTRHGAGASADAPLSREMEVRIWLDSDLPRCPLSHRYRLNSGH